MSTLNPNSLVPSTKGSWAELGFKSAGRNCVCGFLGILRMMEKSLRKFVIQVLQTWCMRRWKQQEEAMSNQEQKSIWNSMKNKCHFSLALLGFAQNLWQLWPRSGRFLPCCYFVCPEGICHRTSPGRLIRLSPDCLRPRICRCAAADLGWWWKIGPRGCAVLWWNPFVGDTGYNIESTYENFQWWLLVGGSTRIQKGICRFVRMCEFALKAAIVMHSVRKCWLDAQIPSNPCDLVGEDFPHFFGGVRLYWTYPQNFPGAGRSTGRTLRQPISRQYRGCTGMGKDWTIYSKILCKQDISR